MNTELALRDKRHLISADIAIQPPGNAGGYESALWATGVAVLGWEQFGSYQGDWFALILFPNGEKYFIHDYYGSCSGCDAFEAEFGYDSQGKSDYLHRLRDFGREYLADCMTYEQAVAEASLNLTWDHDAEQAVDWVKKIWAEHA
jgi:hypothetical protein